MAGALLLVIAAGSEHRELTVPLIAIEWSLGLATVTITAAWAVLGPGSYLKRLICSHLIGSIVGAGFLSGFAVVKASNSHSFADYFFWEFQNICLGIGLISFAAQVPFWFVRFLFGWHFTFGSSPPAKSFSLWDIFVFTFLAALAIGGPQVAANIVEESYDGYGLDQVSYSEVFPDGSEIREEGVILPDGTLAEKTTSTQPDGKVSTTVEVIMSQAEYRQWHREFLRSVRANALLPFVEVGAKSFGISLLSLPILLLMFRTKDPEAGCVLTVFYAFIGIILITFISVVFVFELGPLEEAMMGIPGLLFISYVAVVSIAFYISRRVGFRLTSLRRYRRENERS